MAIEVGEVSVYFVFICSVTLNVSSTNWYVTYLFYLRPFYFKMVLICFLFNVSENMFLAKHEKLIIVMWA